jgi:hypothetical protein
MTRQPPHPLELLVKRNPVSNAGSRRRKAARHVHLDNPETNDMASQRKVRGQRWHLVALLTTLTLSLSACSRIQDGEATRAATPHPVELSGGESHSLNYTPWYIHTFEIQGPPESGVRGGGGNTVPMREDGGPSEGGGMCCTSYPLKWQPDLRLTVRWKADKKQDGKTPGYWYKAENVRIPQYGQQTYGVWAIFLPGDRVRLMITDGNRDGGNNPNNRPADDDPLIVQGVLDDEWNRLYRDGGDAQ